MNELATTSESKPVSIGLLSAGTAAELVHKASGIAAILSDLIERQHLFVPIAGRKYVRVEAWTSLAAILGCTVREVETVCVDGVYTSTVELVRMADGAVLSRASAECGAPDDGAWRQAPAYARRSMAITRAAGKVCRLVFSWIVVLAGYEGTPAEEVVQAEPAAHEQPQSGNEGYDPSQDNRPVTEPQLRLLEARIKRSGVDREKVKRWVKRHYGVEHFNGLTRAQFAVLLDKLESITVDEGSTAEVTS